VFVWSGVLNKLAVVPSHLGSGFYLFVAGGEGEQAAGTGGLVSILEATGLVGIVADKAIEELVIRRQLPAVVKVVDELFIRPADRGHSASVLGRGANG
jgi:hypothetical protein